MMKILLIVIIPFLAVLQNSQAIDYQLVHQDSSLDEWQFQQRIEPLKLDYGIRSSVLTKNNSLIVGDLQGNIKVIDLNSGNVKRIIGKVHQGEIRSILLSPSEEYIYTLSSDGKVKRLNFSTEQVDLIFNNTVELWRMISDSDFKMIYFTFMTTIKQYNSVDNSLFEFYKSPFNSQLQQLLIDEDEKLLITGDKSGSIHIINLLDGILIKTFTAHIQEVLYLVIREQTLVTCSQDGRIKIWDMRSYQELQNFGNTNNKVGIGFIKLIQNDTVIVSSSRPNYSIQFWDTVIFQEIPSQRINLIGFSYDIQYLEQENILIIPSKDGTLQIRDMKTFRLIPNLNDRQPKFDHVGPKLNNCSSYIQESNKFYDISNLTMIRSFRLDNLGNYNSFKIVVTLFYESQIPKLYINLYTKDCKNYTTAYSQTEVKDCYGLQQKLQNFYYSNMKLILECPNQLFSADSIILDVDSSDPLYFSQIEYFAENVIIISIKISQRVAQIKRYKTF